MCAQHGLHAQAQEGRLGERGQQVVDDALGQPVDPLLCDSVRDQDNRKARARCLGARGREQLAGLHAGQIDVDERQARGMWRRSWRQSGIGGENYLNARAGRRARRVQGRQAMQVRAKRAERLVGFGRAS